MVVSLPKCSSQAVVRPWCFTYAMAELNQGFDLPLPNSVYEEGENSALWMLLIRDDVKIAITDVLLVIVELITI